MSRYLDDQNIKDEGKNLVRVLMNELNIGERKAIEITKAISWLVDLAIREGHK
jgi:hypothetical protein